MKNKSLVVQEQAARKVSRRELAHSLLSGIAAGVFLPELSPLHPVCSQLMNAVVLDSADATLPADQHKRVFLSASQFSSLEKISEAIVPGSRKAQSAAFIDLLLGVDSAKSQQEFAASLAALEATAEKTFHKSVASLSQAQLNELLQSASIKDSGDYAHFENLKGWAVGAYYSSEIGMRELGWTPDRVFANFPVCAHAESHS